MKDYRYAIRNYNISDDEYYEIINDLIHEIAYKTDIWKKEFWFDVIDGQDYYDLNALLTMYEHSEYSTIKDIAPEGYDDDTKDYSKSIANIIDVRLFQKLPIGGEVFIPNKNYSAICSDFQYENRFVLRYIGEPIKDNYEYKRYMAVVSIVPTAEQITEARETMITGAFITGLQYKAETMYSSKDDFNYTTMLKQAYEYEIKKIKDMEANSAYWQNKFLNKRWGL